jgi:signal transduction histidine kinase
MLREAMTDMRAVAAGLRLPELAPLSAEDVATRAAQDHQRRSGTTVRLTTEGVPQTVPLPVKIALFRSLQEALSNATRHGHSEAVDVRLTATRRQGPARPAGLSLDVRDAGTGFDPSTLARSEGLGLAGIREQAEILGGTFELRSSPGDGTEVRVWWPVQDVAEAT